MIEFLLLIFNILYCYSINGLTDDLTYYLHISLVLRAIFCITSFIIIDTVIISYVLHTNYRQNLFWFLYTKNHFNKFLF